MKEFRFSISEMVKLSDCVSSTNDLLSLFSEAATPLGSLGVFIRSGYVVLVTDNDGDDESAVMSEVVYIVDRACSILELVTENIIVISDDSDSDSLDYYNSYQCNYSDDTAFDYHGTYVQAILDAMLLVARSRGVV